MEFLQSIEDRGYPTDYLLARIHGRRVLLLREWDDVLFSPDLSEYLISTHYREFIPVYAVEGIWKRYLKELQWIYYQMNKKLRYIFQPFFMYSELNTLLTCLRYKSGKGNKAEIERVLVFSLLSEKIKDMLGMETDLPSVLEVLEKRLVFLSLKSPGLNNIFTKDGLKGVEQNITGILLGHIISLELHPVMKRFFTSVINSKNIITLYKHMKWGVTAKPVLIDGGSIKEASLSKVMHSQEISEVVQLIYKQTGLYVDELTASSIDNTLRKGITRQMKILERESPDIGLILNYLWRCSMEARNLSIISYGEKLDKTIIKGELVH